MAKIDGVQEVSLELLKPYENNAKIHSETQVKQIADSISEFGFLNPCLIDKDFNIIAGHGRVMAAKKLGMETVPCIFVEGLSEAQRRAYILADNRLTELGEWDFDKVQFELRELADMDFNVDLTGFEAEDYLPHIDHSSNISLAERFIAPPFSILDTRQGYWQDRKNDWKNLGIKSEQGRRDNLTSAVDVDKLNYDVGMKGMAPQTSIFDPVLCEVVYRWFNTKEGNIYDCFAGGSVRGIVAEKLGYKYTGIELRKEQVEANYSNADEIGVKPCWICDDSLNADKYLNDESADLIFTCPPYADLEVYSDDERDISNMSYDDFCKTYAKILEIAIRKLKNDRFGVIVIANVRDKKGAKRDLVKLTKDIFYSNGMILYNEIILVNMIGTGAIRAPKQFTSLRKVVTVHQDVLVFYKGDPKKINENYEEIDVSELTQEEYND